VTERILVVDDEPDILDVVAYNLEQAGYRVTPVRDGRTAIAEAERQRPDLVVLDIMLPDLSGMEVCRSLRRSEKTRAVPILMLTARSDEVDRVVGFEVGADDYVTKPFSPRELVLRVRAILRRRASTPGETDEAILTHGCLTLDVARHEVEVDAKVVDLTSIEFKLLYDLMSRRGRVQSRDTLLDRVWGYATGVETRTVDTHVKRLREKLGRAGAYIETVRGVGYKFSERDPG
jgi:two-component system phosphate regulon response regulator PhoB